MAMDGINAVQQQRPTEYYSSGSVDDAPRTLKASAECVFLNSSSVYPSCWHMFSQRCPALGRVAPSLFSVGRAATSPRGVLPCTMAFRCKGLRVLPPDVSGSSKSIATPIRRVRPRLFRPQAFVFLGLPLDETWTVRVRHGPPDELEEHIADKHSPS